MYEEVDYEVHGHVSSFRVPRCLAHSGDTKQDEMKQDDTKQDQMKHDDMSKDEMKKN